MAVECVCVFVCMDVYTHHVLSGSVLEFGHSKPQETRLPNSVPFMLLL